jgi:hypothetical protein
MNSVNLIPMARQLSDARRVRAIRWVCISTATVALLFAADRALRFNSAKSLAIDSGQFARLENDIAVKTRTTNQLRHEIEALDRLAKASRVVTEHPDYSTLLGLLSRCAGSEITLGLCAVDRPQHGEDTQKSLPPVLRVNGTGVSQSAVTSFVLRIESTGVFDQVTLLRSNEQSDAMGSSTAFQLECLFDGSGKEAP